MPWPSTHYLQKCGPTAQDLDVLDLFSGQGGVHRSCSRSLNVSWLSRKDKNITHWSLRFQRYVSSQVRQGLGQGIHGYDNIVQFSVVGFLEEVISLCFAFHGIHLRTSQTLQQKYHIESLRHKMIFIQVSIPLLFIWCWVLTNRIPSTIVCIFPELDVLITQHCTKIGLYGVHPVHPSIEGGRAPIFRITVQPSCVDRKRYIVENTRQS